MNNPELCPSCQRKNRKTCEFEEVVNIIAKGVPPLFLQNPITPGSEIRDSAAAAHSVISTCREIAKERNCPYAGSVNPNYPGKKYL